jgi:CubicO group peptidase (beta-lactamase class C family)
MTSLPPPPIPCRALCVTNHFVLNTATTYGHTQIRGLRYLKPSTGFRDLWQYNNHMYTLLSYFPSLLVGVPFEKYVNDFILEPLGMDSTTYYSERAEESGELADGMLRDGVNLTEDVFGLGRVRAVPYWAPNKIGASHGSSKSIAVLPYTDT